MKWALGLFVKINQVRKGKTAEMIDSPHISGIIGKALYVYVKLFWMINALLVQGYDSLLTTAETKKQQGTIVTLIAIV